tara:strand:+ start:21009 stop:21464 length:456 start_codon:yes stop_codon:yes gene_type:complete
MNTLNNGSNQMNLARGYISSGIFNGNRTPQHLQNQIVKSYCDSNNLQFVLSRAEYWINGSTHCQLWAALKEGIKNIVFFSIWLLPDDRLERLKIYKYCLNNDIVFHFATERMTAGSSESTFMEVELLLQTNHILLATANSREYLNDLRKLM